MLSASRSRHYWHWCSRVFVHILLGHRSVSYSNDFYLFSILYVVALSISATAIYNLPSTSRALVSLRRARSYTLLSIVAGILIEALGHRLSVFHTVAANHLLQLNFVSGFAEHIFPIHRHLSRPARRRSPQNTSTTVSPTRIDTPNTGWATFGTRLDWLILELITFVFYPFFIALFLGGLDSCSLSLPSGENINGFETLHWTIFFRLQVQGQAAVMSPLMSTYAHLMVFGIVAAGWGRCVQFLNRRARSSPEEEKNSEADRTRMRVSDVPAWIGVFGLLIFFLSEVVGIEWSLRYNQNMEETENQWGYGQVTSIVLLLALVDPAVELAEDAKRVRSQGWASAAEIRSVNSEAARRSRTDAFDSTLTDSEVGSILAAEAENVTVR
jgi:hypothetical protein